MSTAPQQRREHQVVRQVDHTAEELLGIERFERLLVGKGDPREQVYQTRREAGGEERAAAELPAETMMALASSGTSII